MTKDKVKIRDIQEATGATWASIKSLIAKEFPGTIKPRKTILLTEEQAARIVGIIQGQPDEQAIAIPFKTKNKVAIVGYAPSSRNLAPYDNPEFEIWGVNELYKIVPRVDKLFELHHRKWFRSKARNPQHLEWLKSAKIPIITLEKYDDIPASIPFPIKEVEKFLDPYDGYFTNSISYMLALAIMLDYEEIHIYGVDMATEEEYHAQRPSVEFYAGIAAGVYKATGRCQLYIPPECDLLKTAFQYGYDGDKMTSMKKKIKARRLELQNRMAAAQQEAANANARIHNFMGAVDDMNYFERCLFNDASEVGLDDT